MDLAKLIHPISIEDFFENFWEKKSLLVSRNQMDHLSELFCLRDLDYVLGHLTKDTKVQIANGHKGREASNAINAGLNTLNRFYESFYEGNTLIVEGLHKIWGPVGRLCQNLMAQTDMETQANLYVTPPGGIGFKCHWDGHDVLILQLEGKKNWKIYPNISRLPRPGSAGGAYQNRHKRARKFVMQPGNVLYLPRGTPHEATAVDEPSVHITVGLMATTWEDLLIAAVRSLSVKRPELGKSLPLGWMSDSELVNSLLRDYRALTEELFTESNVKEGLDLLGRDLLENATSLPDGHFTQIKQLEDISRDTIVEKRSGNLLRIVPTENGPVLFFPGGSQPVTTKLSWALRFIADAKSLKVSDIPGWYNDRERLLLVKQLVRKGFLRIVSLNSNNH